MTAAEFLEQWHDGGSTVEVCTSGSTGEPKRMLVEKSRMRASAVKTCSFLGLRAGDTALLCMPVDFIAGKMMVVRSEVCGLSLDVVEPTGHPLAHTGESGYDFAAMVPLQVYNSLSEPGECERLRRIRHLIIGGGAVDEALEARLKDMPGAVWSTYGMTETLSHIAMRRISGPQASEWYEPLPSVEVHTDGLSRLVIHAPDVNPEILTTNDIALMNPDGRRFRILGRADNVICSGGIKIQIEEVEAMLRGKLPCDFMVTRCPDPKFGCMVALLHTPAPESVLRSLCEAVLPKYMQPRRYLEVEALPLTPTGKPARARAEAYFTSSRT